MKNRKAKAPMAHSTYTAPLRWSPPKQVMEINGVKIYGCSVFDLAEIPDLSLVIDLSNTQTPEQPLVTGNAKAQRELPASLFAARVSIIYIGWEDGTAHTLPTRWWGALITEIENQPEGFSVAVCCVGGTGRTGTALAILAGLSDQLGPDDTDPVAWVRAHYCDYAVETDVQISYVEKVTGFPVLSAPSNSFFEPMSAPHGRPGTGTQVALLPQGTVIDSFGAPASVGASDHTGS